MHSFSEPQNLEFSIDEQNRTTPMVFVVLLIQLIGRQNLTEHYKKDCVLCRIESIPTTSHNRPSKRWSQFPARQRTWELPSGTQQGAQPVTWSDHLHFSSKHRTTGQFLRLWLNWWVFLLDSLDSKECLEGGTWKSPRDGSTRWESRLGPLPEGQLRVHLRSHPGMREVNCEGSVARTNSN